MLNGNPGVHPYADIVVDGHDAYSPRAAGLVRKIARLGDEKTRRELGDLLLHEYNESQKPDVEKLERVLTDWRDRLRREARERGFEMDED